MTSTNDMNEAAGARPEAGSRTRRSPGRSLACSLILLAALGPALPARAQPSSAGSGQGAPASASSMTEGEVRKVDRDGGKLTLRHGPIAALDMQAMTMVFRVAEPQMLDAWKEGDRVRFMAARIGGALTVTRIERAD